MKPAISKKVKELPLQDFLEVMSRRKPVKGALDLTMGLPDFDVPERVKEAAITAIHEGKNKYTGITGLPELKQALCEKLQEKNKIRATPEQILVTGAASGGLMLALQSLINPGDEVVLFDPYFITYKALVLQAGGIPIVVKTKNDFSLDLSGLEKKITPSTKAILLNTPHNPTGKVYSGNEIRALAEIANEHDIFVIADEVYEDFCYEKKHVSVGSLYDKTITVNSFSKCSAMTGWRIGYAVGPREIMQEMLKLQLLFYVCAPTPFQYAAITALSEDAGNFLKEYREKRDFIYRGLKGSYEMVRPEGAFYAFIRYPCAPKKFLQACEERKLFVVPGKIFSEEDTHFRISFAQSDEVLKKAVDVLREIAKEYSE